MKTDNKDILLTTTDGFEKLVGERYYIIVDGEVVETSVSAIPIMYFSHLNQRPRFRYKINALNYLDMKNSSYTAAEIVVMFQKEEPISIKRDCTDKDDLLKSILEKSFPQDDYFVDNPEPYCFKSFGVSPKRIFFQAGGYNKNLWVYREHQNSGKVILLSNILEK